MLVGRTRLTEESCPHVVVIRSTVLVQNRKWRGQDLYPASLSADIPRQGFQTCLVHHHGHHRRLLHCGCGCKYLAVQVSTARRNCPAESCL